MPAKATRFVFSDAQMARIKEYIPAFRAKVAELDPEWRGHCKQLSDWKAKTVNSLLAEEIFAGKLSETETLKQWSSAIVRVWTNHFNYDIKVKQGKKGLQKTPTISTAKTPFLQLSSNATPRDHFVVENNDRIVALYRQISQERGIPGGAARQIAIQQLWSKEDHKAWEEKVRHMRDDIDANRAEFDSVAQEALEGLLTGGQLGSCVLSLSYAFRKGGNIFGGKVSAAFDSNEGALIDDGKFEYDTASLERWNNHAKSVLPHYTQDGDATIPWDAIYSNPDMYYDTETFNLPIGALKSPQVLEPDEILALTKYLRLLPDATPFKFYSKDRIAQHQRQAELQKLQPSPSSHSPSYDDASPSGTLSSPSRLTNVAHFLTPPAKTPSRPSLLPPTSDQAASFSTPPPKTPPRASLSSLSPMTPLPSCSPPMQHTDVSSNVPQTVIGPSAAGSPASKEGHSAKQGAGDDITTTAASTATIKPKKKPKKRVRTEGPPVAVRRTGRPRTQAALGPALVTDPSLPPPKKRKLRDTWYMEPVSEFHRFGQLSLRQRGFDTNAIRVPTQTLPDDVASAFDNYYERSWHEGAKFSHRKNDVNGRPRRPAKESNFYRVTVNDSAINQTEAFFVPAPAYRPSVINPFTRGSRRSLAFLDHPDKSERKMCFMKDSWQEDSARTAPEADIYRRLHEHGVPNIASMRLGNDVDDLKTETQEWWGSLNHSGRFKRFGFGFMVCHRLVLNTVARDLSTFTWCKVLLSCLADVVDAAQAAFKAGILHRDISASNIMIVMDKETKEWRGVLIDWDMCLLLEKREKHLQKTGTWGFISARILQARSSQPVVMHSLGDDMESIFWVLVYQVLRYTRHDHGPEQLHKQMDSLFNDMTITENKEVIGGSQKICTIMACSIHRVDIALGKFNISRLHDVFATIGQEFHPRYYEPPKKGGLRERLKIERRPAPVSTVDWDSPDDKWFSTFLRREAEGMQPLGITPTALESPNNDSKPPVYPALWKRARISRYPPDFFEMPQCSAKDVYNFSKKDKNEKANNKVVTSSRLNYMDGLSASASKRPLKVDEKEAEEDGGRERDASAAQPKAKRQCLV
ncbi:hypothetical protein JR316_0000172 [Psilocybe cubensis]|uniref:Uncharacterized protein n=1 Tax=Psilocybe cubensis TaxID=181762 RepID=A0ACB8HDL2_PSICU|nr:hypothetical protein JR316_0000172 [Psilocybe cubensis]KAH9486108.1 hypothetical protein JR316_0000172 [Psilocybe cubensis]